MVNVCYESSYISKDIWQCLINNQIAHYFVNGSDFDINIFLKIKCLISISKSPLLLKHPVYSSHVDQRDTNIFLLEFDQFAAS